MCFGQVLNVVAHLEIHTLNFSLSEGHEGQRIQSRCLAFLLSTANILTEDLTVQLCCLLHIFKGLRHQKFSHPDVVPNLYDVLSSMEYKERYYCKCVGIFFFSTHNFFLLQ